GSGGTGGTSGTDGIGTSGGAGTTVEAEPNFGSNFQKLPFILSYDPSSDLVVTFELPGGSRLDLATIFIPAGATNERATLTISYPLDLSNYLDGDLDLSILLQSQTTGQLIESLLEALELRTWTSTGTPRLQELNGSILELTNLSEPRLSLDIDAGIFRFTDDSIQVLSKKLSRFTNSRTEPTPLWRIRFKTICACGPQEHLRKSISAAPITQVCTRRKHLFESC
ncbi:MAG: hypothetical protein EBX09_02910, partial [Actinobacteria bacterium]|nr:hypothetical protein [Actinomycetota bacterium]